MQFHISCHHTPENYGIHRSPDGLPHHAVTSWSERCKEVGVEYIKGGVNQPQHQHFPFVETGDMDKSRVLMKPVMGYWDIVITPVLDLN